MAEILGWLRTAGEMDLSNTGAWRPIGSTASLGASRFNIQTTGADGVFLSNGIQACIEGSPCWDNPTLARIASREGHSKALGHAYADYGTMLFPRLRGHFALAIIDEQHQRLILAVDRLGTRPMCYAQTPEGIAFASSAETLRRNLGGEAKISLPSLYSYIYFHVIPSPETVYCGISKLEPAQYLDYRDAHSRLAHYWTPSFSSQGSDPERLKAELRTTLEHAVRSRVDGPTGAFLSGGLDSSTVSGMLSGVLSGPADTFSIGFSEEGYDEIGFARIAAKHFNTSQHEYYVKTEDVADAIPRIARAYDEPFGNSSAIPTLLCAQLAHRHGMQTLLAGDGGDELFAGNKRYAKQRLFDTYFRLPEMLRNRLIEPLFLSSLLNRLPPGRKISRYIEQAKIPMPQRMQSYNLLHRVDVTAIFEPEFLAEAEPSQPERRLLEVYERTPSDDVLHKMLYLDWKITLADNDLRKVNRMCELAGVSVRYPMLDDALVELSARVPPTLNLRHQSLRYFYKEAFKDFLPQEIIRKKKHGFGLPFGQWLRKSARLQDLVFTSLESLESRRIIRCEFVNQLLQAHRSGHAAYFGSSVWVLTMLEQWFQEHDASP